MIHEVETGRGYSEITKPTSSQSPHRRLGESVISPRPWLESKRVDEFANMSDEELRQYVYGTKELDS